MKILLIGKTGRIGFELQRSLALLGEVAAPDRAGCDLARPDTLRAAIRAERPDAIVNAAAYTAVDEAERQPALAMRLNAEGPGSLAAEARAAGALLVHYSTDYVFDGRKDGAYLEDDEALPVNAYGRSKLAGEQAVRQAGGRHLILRTSWVHGAFGGSFLKTVLALMRERESLDVVADQRGAPTPAALVADATAWILAAYARAGARRAADFPFGTYHLAASGSTTWHGYAVLAARLARQAGMALRTAPQDIRPVPASASPRPAVRPANSRLDTARLRRAFGLALPDWQAGVEQAVRLIAQQWGERAQETAREARPERAGDSPQGQGAGLAQDRTHGQAQPGSASEPGQ